MSRIGKTSVAIPAGVIVTSIDGVVTVKGPKGELKREVHPNINVEVKENEIIITRNDEQKFNKSLHGLTRSLIQNMVEGVTTGFEKKLEIVGVGYRAQANKNKISLTLGYSHPVEYTAPEGIEFEMDQDKKNIITVRGINKQTVGEVAAKVRSYRKPEPYKGKGIRYQDEQVARKAGKASGSS